MPFRAAEVRASRACSELIVYGEHTIDELVHVLAINSEFVIFHKAVVEVGVKGTSRREERVQWWEFGIFGYFLNRQDHSAVSARFDAAPVHLGDYDMRCCTPEFFGGLEHVACFVFAVGID